MTHFGRLRRPPQRTSLAKRLDESRKKHLEAGVTQPLRFALLSIQRPAKRLVRGCEKFLADLALLFCLALPGSCLARHTNLYFPLYNLGTWQNVQTPEEVELLPLSTFAAAA